MNIKKWIALAAVFGCALTFCACASSGNNGKTDTPFDEFMKAYEGSAEEMVIGAHGAPPSSAENYIQAKEMGLTHLYVDKCDETTLAAANNSGLRLIASTGNALGTTNPVVDWKTDYSEEKFSAVDAVGYYDEPMPDKFDLIAEWAEMHNEKYEGKDDAPEFMVNLHPMDAFPNSNFPDTSDEEYISSFCEKVLAKLPEGERILSYDLYPIRSLWRESGGKLAVEKNYVADEWLRSLELMGKYSKLYGAETHAYLQTMGFWLPYDGGWTCRVPTEEDIRLQAYTSMAFGIRNFSHFAYWSTDDLMVSYGYSLACTTLDGEPNDTYYAAQTVNRELLGLDGVFLCFEHTGNMTFKGSENPYGNRAFSLLRESKENLKAVSRVDCNADTVIGQFEDTVRGYDGLMIVNYNETSDVINDTVELTLKEGSGMAVYSRGVWKEKKAIGGKVTIELSAGDGAFAVVLK